MSGARANAQVAEFLNHMLAEADPVATRFDRVGIGRSYLAPNTEPPSGDGVLSTNGESGYARDGVVAKRPGSTASPAIPDGVVHYTTAPTVEKELGTLKEYFCIRPVSQIVDLFRMCATSARSPRARALSCSRAPDGTAGTIPMPEARSASTSSAAR